MGPSAESDAGRRFLPGFRVVEFRGDGEAPGGASRESALSGRTLATFVRTVEDRYTKENSKPIFVNWGGVLPEQFASPLDDFRYLRQLPMISLGWWTGSPTFDDLLAPAPFRSVSRGL